MAESIHASFALPDPVTTRPSLTDVGSLVFSRTLEVGGTRKLGTFTANTWPTGDMVDGLINDAAQDVAAVVGIVLPENTHSMVRSVVALGASIQLEEAYYSEQVNTDNLAFRNRQTRYERRLKSLTDAVQDAQDGGDPGGVDDRLMPQFAFPASASALPASLRPPLFTADTPPDVLQFFIDRGW